MAAQQDWDYFNELDKPNAKVQVEKERHGRKFWITDPETIYFPIILWLLCSFLRTGLGASYPSMRCKLLSQEFPEEVVVRREVVDTTVMDGYLDFSSISRVPTLKRINCNLMLGYHRRMVNNLAKFMIVALFSGVGVKEIMRIKGTAREYHIASWKESF